MSLDTSHDRPTTTSGAQSGSREAEIPAQADGAVSALESDAAVPHWFARKRAKSAAVQDRTESQPAAPAASEPETSEAATSEAATPEADASSRSAAALRKQRGVKKSGGPRIVLAAPAEEVLSWQERLKRTLRSFATAAYVVSFVFHLVVLILLSIVWVRGMVGDGAFTTMLTQGDDQVMQFDTLIDSQLDTGGGEPEQLPQFTAVPVDLPEITEPALPEVADIPDPSTLGTDAEGEGTGEGLAFQMPESGKAVTQGSFTVWTVPEDPIPHQAYFIVIQIKVPDKIKRFPTNDLLGMVVGTDRYRQAIPGDARRYLPVKNNIAQLTVRVPGAEALVEDTIQIRSLRILNERQTLKIRF